uniref:Phospholipase A1 member A n=1 Tax=Esox lucius TaxID=8010 RepID=A0A6Q2YWR5_ESOLU
YLVLIFSYDRNPYLKYLPSPGLHTKQDSLGFPSPPHALCPMAWSPEGPSWFPIGPTVMIVPGRRPARLQPSWVRQMADKLLKAGLVNVLVADWLHAVKVSVFIPQNQHGFSPELFHLVGFGVGAHVAGIAGACLEGAVGRITGLDPFSPQFSEADSRLSLDYTDAQYVDVIHTNFNGEPLGHVDFYVGRGHLLPGCPHRYILCSHQWAYRLFTSSIGSSCPITAFPCLGVEDYQKALCTSCHHPGLNTCPLLGYDISWLPPDRPIGFQPVTAVLGIAVKEPFCGQSLTQNRGSAQLLLYEQFIKLLSPPSVSLPVGGAPGGERLVKRPVVRSVERRRRENPGHVGVWVRDGHLVVH